MSLIGASPELRRVGCHQRARRGPNDLLTTATGGGAALAQQHAFQNAVPATPAIPITRYQTGGVVPGSGPQLAIVHGGETVLPPGVAFGGSGTVAAPGLPASIAAATPALGIAGMHVETAGGITGAAAAAAPSAAVTAVTSLKSHIALQSATDAVTNAHTALAKAEAEHVTKSRTAADIATQVAAAERRLTLAEDKLALLREQQALPVTPTKSTTGTSSTSNASLTAALTAFTAALVRAVQNGVPITLDGQAIGDMISQHAYVSASMATSGFVAQGSIP